MDVTVESWIHPLAAIWNAGEKVVALAKRDFTTALLPKHHLPLLRTCQEIMNVWMGLAKYVPKDYYEKLVKVDETNDNTKGKDRSTRTSKRAASSPTPNSAFDGDKTLMDRNLDLILDGSHASGRSSKRRRTVKDASEAAQGNASAGGSSAAGSGRAR